MKLADRIDTINEPQTIAMAKLSRELAAQGHDVISLSLGEPDFVTPKHILDAAKDAMDKGFTFYTPVAGIPELRRAICDKLLRENGLTYEPEQIVVSTGAKHAIMNVIMALINPGDEVIIPTPYWVSYSEMVKLMGGIPVFVHAGVEQQFKITTEQLKQAITSKTKAFMFSSPCNPTGSVYDKSELAALVKVFEQHENIVVISDEIYEHINFVEQHYSIASFGSIKDRVVVINGMSKGYAMTGWRIGYIAAPLALSKACEKIQGQYTSGTNVIAQHASVAALNGTQEPTQHMRKAYQRRRDLVINGLQQIEGLKCNMPDGAFYAFPDVSSFFGKSHGTYQIKTATDLCLYLLNEVHVSMVTGEAFGAPLCVRISYATADEKLVTALARIKKGLEQLK
ncbi:MAG: pyridoxal phosphate-dependent aminotransferase [Bacteroidia bacterium]|jgi:aspartate aminotransferase|nr:pyridoxal phosphate-dependent aminotransferase [Bacteroidia bacterium]